MAHAFATSRFLAALAFVVAGEFDPGRDLPGYLEAFFSPDNDLYSFEAFKGRTGEEVDEKTLQELRDAWTKETVRVAAELKRLEGDPQARFARSLAKSIPNDRFFKTIPVDRRAGKGVVFFIQKPPIDKPRYADIVAKTYSDHVEALIVHFEDAFAKPLGLERDPTRPAIALFVLASRGAYDDYLRATFPGKSPDEAQVAHYDRLRGFAVTYAPGEAGPVVRETELRERVLHETVHALVHAYSPGEGAMRVDEPLWVEEGLAEYLSTFEENALEKAFEFGGVQTEWLRNLLEVERRQPLGDVLISPLPALLTAKTYREVEDMARLRAAERGVPIDEASVPFSVRLFYDRASLLVSYLLDGEGGRYRDGFLRYLAREIRGVAGESELKRETGFTSLEEMDKGFRAHVAALTSGRLPHLARKEAPAETASAAPKAAVAAAMGFRPESPRVVTARALQIARGGDVAAALEAAAKTPGVDADDVATLESLLKLSDAVLEAAKKDGKAFVIQGEKATINGVVTSFDAREIVLLDYKKKELRVPRRAFGLDLVVQRIRSKSLAIGDPATLATALLVAGKPIETALKGVSGAAADAVRRRAERWRAFPAEADAATRLERLAPHLTAAAPAGDVDAAIADLDALFGPLRATEATAQNRDALFAIGGRLLEAAFDRRGIDTGVFESPVTALPDGRVEIRYSFTSPGEPADFTEKYRHTRRLESTLFDAAKARHTPAPFRVEAGRLTTKGCAFRIHDARFRGPARCEFTYRFKTDLIDEKNPSIFVAGFADDATGSFAAAVEINALVVANVKSGRTHVLQVPQAVLEIGRDYRIALEREKNEFVFSVDGEVLQRAPDEGIGSLRFIMLSHGSATFEVSDLALTGTLDPALLEEKRAAFVAERRAKWTSSE